MSLLGGIGDIIGGVVDSVFGDGSFSDFGNTVGGLFGISGDQLGSDLGDILGAGAKAFGLLGSKPPSQSGSNFSFGRGVQQFGPESMSDARVARGLQSVDPNQEWSFWLNKMKTYGSIK